MDPPPQSLYRPLSSWVICGTIVDRHSEPFTEVLDDVCDELRA